MAKLSTKKINVGDFSPENRADLSKIARSLNPFFDDVERILRKGLSVEDNLPFQYLEFIVEVDASGIPLNTLNLSTNLTTSIRGVITVDVESMVDGVYPNSFPLLITSKTLGKVEIKKIIGLPANTKFKFTIMVVS